MIYGDIDPGKIYDAVKQRVKQCLVPLAMGHEAAVSLSHFNVRLQEHTYVCARVRETRPAVQLGKELPDRPVQ